MLEGRGRNKASLADSWDCDDCDTDVLIDCTARPFAVPAIAAGYATDGASPRSSATNIAMMVLAQHKGIFSTIGKKIFEGTDSVSTLLLAHSNQ